METEMSRADFLNEDGHRPPPTDEEISDAEGEIEKANKWLDTQVSMLIESAKHAGLIVKLNNIEQMGLREALYDTFAHEHIEEQQSIIEPE